MTPQKLYKNHLKDVKVVYSQITIEQLLTYPLWDEFVERVDRKTEAYRKQCFYSKTQT